MKYSVQILSVSLALWMCGSSYWYVHNIKDLNPAETDHPSETSETSEISEISEISEKDEKDEDNMNSSDSSKGKNKTNPNKKTVTIENKVVYFESGEENLKLDTKIKSYFNELKSYMNEHKSKSINVVGHTDIIGNEEDNMALGLKRAEFVKNILIEKGIGAGQIRALSMGEKNPVSLNGSADDKNLDRRVEIIIN